MRDPKELIFGLLGNEVSHRLDELSRAKHDSLKNTVGVDPYYQKALDEALNAVDYFKKISQLSGY
jgi:hypothetical protein